MALESSLRTPCLFSWGIFIGTAQGGTCWCFPPTIGQFGRHDDTIATGTLHPATVRSPRRCTRFAHHDHTVAKSPLHGGFRDRCLEGQYRRRDRSCASCASVCEQCSSRRSSLDRASRASARGLSANAALDDEQAGDPLQRLQYLHAMGGARRGECRELPRRASCCAALTYRLLRSGVRRILPHATRSAREAMQPSLKEIHPFNGADDRLPDDRHRSCDSGHLRGILDGLRGSADGTDSRTVSPAGSAVPRSAPPGRLTVAPFRRRLHGRGRA